MLLSSGLSTLVITVHDKVPMNAQHKGRVRSRGRTSQAAPPIRTEVYLYSVFSLTLHSQRNPLKVVRDDNGPSLPFGHCSQMCPSLGFV